MTNPNISPLPRFKSRNKSRGMQTPSPTERRSPWTPPPFQTSVQTPLRHLDLGVVQEQSSFANVASPLTVASPSPSHRNTGSPYGFIPIRNDDNVDSPGGGGPYTPRQSTPLRQAAKPFAYSTPRKVYHHSTNNSSNMRNLESPYSQGTAETAESSLMTALRAASPAALSHLTPPLYRKSPSPTMPTGSNNSRSQQHKTSSSTGRKSSSSVSSVSSLTGRKSPFKAPPAEDESVKKIRLKTELCLHYVAGRPCPFGVNCTYAHGEEELQMTKLLDLGKAGLIDVETYRTRPCWSWVATGSCPFGKRCGSIHDPRVAGLYPSWLTHTETQGNSIATDINVEAMHQKMHHHIHCGTPFGEAFLPAVDTWAELYKRISNIDYSQQTKSSWVERRKAPTSIPALAKIHIALATRGPANFSYKFRPQHVIYGELCMVLQKRAFAMTASQDIMELPLRDYTPSRPNHILVHELAFGPDADSTVRGVALWFNIREADVVQYTAAHAKRYRWKRSLKKETTHSKKSTFDHCDHFHMIRPHDPDAFALAAGILENRLHMLQAERIDNLKPRSDQLALVRKEKDALKERFEAMLRHWIHWNWPVNQGRGKVNKRTPVPPVDGLYEHPVEVDELEGFELGQTEGVCGDKSQSVWQSFTECEFNLAEDEQDKCEPAIRRLAVFDQLAQGRELCTDRYPPHILDHRLYKAAELVGSQQERCWKALLLQPEDMFVPNEWDMVQGHFDNSRSKKVLDIIQQK